MDKFTQRLIKAVIIYFVCVVVFVAVFQTYFMLSLVPSESMAGTIQAGDFILSTRYDVGDIERYDVLIFVPPDESNQTYIKRLIGLPGETIEISGGKVYADGMELDDTFVKAPMDSIGDGIYTVPENCYFFLGDNRNNSCDSRFWEEKYVPLQNIQAKAKFILFPFSDVCFL